jgi:CheY-like chemotaxis protein
VLTAGNVLPALGSLTYAYGQVTFAISPLIRGIFLARKILLADDSVTAQNMGRKILADAGYEVIAVNNGSAALKKIAELKPDLAILDVYMPGYSGLEVCQRLKESPETARIPVLLTVGKLEPFKPEEAQRVRAEGYIVKPFEASELLSALEKLEDKVVPRAESSKPGRFARAIAAAEETARGSRGEGAIKENGWKSRIGFPQKKTEPEEKVADESSIYNQVNRDLRTVVETAAEETADRKRQLLGEQSETRVDVPAPVPSDLPGDVTPEEVAAIAAAVAKMQMSAMATQDDRVAETSNQPGVGPTLDRDLPADEAAPLNKEVETAASEESKVSQLDAAEIDHRRNGDEKPDEREDEREREETRDVPITMAATAESVASGSVGESRWTAVAVALEGEEAGLSLEHEMQKAYASAEPYLAAVATMPEEQTAPAGNSPDPYSPAPAESTVDAKVGAISNPEPATSELAIVAYQSELEPEPATQSLAAQADPPALTSTLRASESHDQPASASSQQSETAVDALIPSDAVPSEARAEKALTTEVAGATQEYVESQSPMLPKPVSEETVFASPAVANPAQAEVAGAYADGAQELPPGPISEAAQVVVSSPACTPIVKDEKPTEQAPEPKPETETVKSTAAAWASWRQIRDTSKSAEVTQDHSRESDVPQPAQAETAAMAAAAGAEQLLQAAESSEPNRNPSDVASIVDSVLADLRPKLMEEISRKMSQKK